MNFDIVFVLLALIGMIAALVWDKMRPGMPIDQETASRGEDHRLQGAGEDAPARSFRVGVPE